MAPTTAIDPQRIEAPAPNGAASADAWTGHDSVLAALVLIVAVALLLLAGNQLLTQLTRIPANSYYELRQTHFRSPEHGQDYLREAIQRLQQIPPARRGAQEWRRLAAAWLLRRVPPDELEQRAQHDRAIRQAVTASLLQEPVQAQAWAYLADLQQTPPADCAAAMAALTQSFRVAPVEPTLATYRLALATRCPLQWTPELLSALRTNLLIPYADDRAIGAWAAERPRVQVMIRRLLQPHPQALARFERVLEAATG
jgi:hypothetical protein